ncbi:MAG TPA: hypothetical protein VI456_09950, partial [Polyangia bacterium]
MAGLTAALLVAASSARAADPVPAPPAPGTYTGPDAPVPPPPAPSRRAAPPPDAGEGAPSNGAAEARAANGGEVRQRSDKEIPRRGRPTFEAQGATVATKPVASFSGTQTRTARMQADPPPPPPKPASPNQVEELVRRSSDNIDFFELVDDMIDEIARRLGLEDPNLLSPMAIRLVRVSANLRPEFAHTLESRLTARLL